MYCRFYKLMSLSDPVISYVIQMSFYYITCIQHIKMNYDLLMTLIKIWKWGTHIFHLHVEEIMPTL
jgi:hypothetical protein